MLSSFKYSLSSTLSSPLEYRIGEAAERRRKRDPEDSPTFDLSFQIDNREMSLEEFVRLRFGEL